MAADRGFVSRGIGYKKCMAFCGRRSPTRYALIGVHRNRGEDGVRRNSLYVNPLVMRTD